MVILASDAIAATSSLPGSPLDQGRRFAPSIDAVATVSDLPLVRLAAGGSVATMRTKDARLAVAARWGWSAYVGWLASSSKARTVIEPTGASKYRVS